jgi:hypothetical protein
MVRTKSNNSRSILKNKGWSILRAYVTKENKKRLDKYQIDNNLPNVDLALDNVLEKFFKKSGGMVK